MSGYSFSMAKWSKKNKDLVEKYFEQLLFMIRNKVLLNGGNLDETKIVWFYPSSMETSAQQNLELKWHDAFKKYISNKIYYKLDNYFGGSFITNFFIWSSFSLFCFFL